MYEFDKIFCTSDIAGIDRYTIENEPIKSIDLMERASLTWVVFFLKKFEKNCPVVVIAGCGNNGGDGYAIARLLSAKGCSVSVWDVSGRAKRSEDCRINRERYVSMGGVVKTLLTIEELEIPENAILIDALFGSGLNRKVEGFYAEVIRAINQSNNTVVAVDIPSGLMGEDNSGNDANVIIRADYTFTFQFPKLAFLLAENEKFVGEWSVLDIGLHPDIIRLTPTSYYILQQEKIAGLLPVNPIFSHKGTNGHGLLIAGRYGMMGAAVLAATAAVRSGIGLLTCHVPAKGCDIMQIAVPEAIVDMDSSPIFRTEVNDVKKYTAVAIGPGIGAEPATVSLLKKLLQEWRGITILDADALNVISEHKELLGLLHRNCILTPHPKEFERLAGKSKNDFERLNKLSTFAQDNQVHVILKGAYTAVASPTGDCFFNTSGNPGMAKGGMGDVLTGVLLALASNGMDTLNVALTGVYAHGLSGDIAADTSGERGVCAGDVARGMGGAWKILENSKKWIKK